MAVGLVPCAGTVAVKVSVAPSITATVFWYTMAAYTRFVFGLTPSPQGPMPTVMDPRMVLLDPSITEMVDPPELPTYTLPDPGMTSSAHGTAPTGTVAITLFEL